MTQDLGPNQTKVIAALRSDRYAQGRDGFLCCNGKYCCLGVACKELLGEPDGRGAARWGRCDGVAPQGLIDVLGLYDNIGGSADNTKSLAELNDVLGLTFPEIADHIEADPSLYFREPR